MSEPKISDEAVPAAAGVLWDIACDYGVDTDTEEFREDARRALAAAVPHLYAQWETELREKIAADIEAHRSAYGESGERIMGFAAWLARGVQTGGQQE